MFLGSNLGFFTSGNYKSYGQLFIKNDNILTLAGSLGSVLNGSIIFGALLTLFSFRVLFISMLIIGITLSVTLQFVIKY